MTDQHGPVPEHNAAGTRGEAATAPQISATEYRADQALAAALIKKSELERRLAIRDENGTYRCSMGYPFRFVGEQRVEMELHLQFVRELIETLTDRERKTDES